MTDERKLRAEIKDLRRRLELALSWLGPTKQLRIWLASPEHATFTIEEIAAAHPVLERKQLYNSVAQLQRQGAIESTGRASYRVRESAERGHDA